MKNETKVAKTAKQRAEAKFKMVGTKLKEDDFKQFEAIFKERGFSNGSQYIKHLIEFDTLGDIENERKQNAILTENIATYKAKNEELEQLLSNFANTFTNMNEKIGNLYITTNKIGEYITKQEQHKSQPTQKVESGLKTYFKGLFNIGIK